jgi:hypothetical protein
MKDELTEKMHSEFTVSEETDRKHKCFAVWMHVGLNATSQELEKCVEFSGVTINEVMNYKSEFERLKV